MEQVELPLLLQLIILEISQAPQLSHLKLKLLLLTELAHMDQMISLDQE